MSHERIMKNSGSWRPPSLKPPRKNTETVVNLELPQTTTECSNPSGGRNGVPHLLPARVQKVDEMPQPTTVSAAVMQVEEVAKPKRKF